MIIIKHNTPIFAIVMQHINAHSEQTQTVNFDYKKSFKFRHSCEIFEYIMIRSLPTTLLHLFCKTIF